MIKVHDIKQFFEENVPKKTITELSYDKANGIPLINSTEQSFDFDNIYIPEIVKDKIKTSDTIYFKDNKIIFVEFKRGRKIPEQEFRLKATESILTFYNFIFSKDFKDNLCLPNNFFKIYFVYDKNNISSTALPTFRNTERKLRIQYKHLISE